MEDKYGIVEDYKATNAEQRFKFEGRELWWNVHETKEEREEGTPLTKALESVRAMVFLLKGSTG